MNPEEEINVLVSLAYSLHHPTLGRLLSITVYLNLSLVGSLQLKDGNLLAAVMIYYRNRTSTLKTSTNLVKLILVSYAKRVRETLGEFYFNLIELILTFQHLHTPLASLQTVAKDSQGDTSYSITHGEYQALSAAFREAQGRCYQAEESLAALEVEFDAISNERDDIQDDFLRIHIRMLGLWSIYNAVKALGGDLLE